MIDQHPSPTEATDQIFAWGKDDICFQVLHLLVLTGGMEDVDLRNEIFDLFNQHRAECDSCWPNVLMTANNCTDPFKKRIYFNVYHMSLFELMRVLGGDARMEQDAEGLRIFVTYPADMNEFWVGGEVYLPGSLTREASITLDVRTEALFRDPRSVLQRLDAISAAEVQTFNRPSGHGIQWWTLVGDRPTRLLVRWQGETHPVAEDWTLVSRYKRLVAKHDPEAPSAEDLTAKAALILREQALNYDGRSWFRGYLKTTLTYRRKDADRHEAKDALSKSVVADLDGSWSATGARRDLRVSQQILKEAKHRSRLEEAEFMTGLSISRKWLEKRLSKRQCRILALKAEGLSDEAVGARLKLRRETVNREMKAIKTAARQKI